jgi:hypothetical protein
VFKDPNHIIFREVDMSFERLWGWATFMKVALLAALVCLISAGQAHAQRRGSLQNTNMQGRCAGGQSGFNNSLQSQNLGSQLYSYPQSQQYSSLQQQQLASLQQQQLLLQAQINALQANNLQANAFQANFVPANAVQVNALRQYVAEQQMLGVSLDDALQSALYALQSNQSRQGRNRR